MRISDWSSDVCSSDLIGGRLAIAKPRCQKPRAMPHPAPRPFSIAARGPLTGHFAVPGDKSISHRALMLGALAIGTSRITGLLEGEDVLATAAAMRSMGATTIRENDGTRGVAGVGVGGLLQPEAALEMGNSGTRSEEH